MIENTAEMLLTAVCFGVVFAVVVAVAGGAGTSVIFHRSNCALLLLIAYTIAVSLYGVYRHTCCAHVHAHANGERSREQKRSDTI